MAVTRKNNVIVSTANGDTYTGQVLDIVNVKCSTGANAGTFTLSVGGTVIYSQTVAANSSPPSDYCEIHIQSSDTITFGMPAAASLFIYIE